MSATQLVEGRAYNRFVTRMHDPAGDAKPFFAKRQAAVLRTVLDLGPLTIEEVKTKSGAIMYKFKAREDKRVSAKVLNAIRLQLTRELERIGALSDNHAYKREYERAERAAETPEQKKQREKDRYAKRRDKEIQRAQRRRDEQKAAKLAMQNLPPAQSL